MKRRFELPIRKLTELPGYSHISMPDLTLYYPALAGMPRDNSVMFFKEVPNALSESIKDVRECLLLVPAGSDAAFEPVSRENLVIPVANPRLEFARVVAFALSQTVEIRSYRTLSNGAVVGEDIHLGDGAVIEPLAFIDHDVVIGDRSLIRTGARVRRFVEIGRDTVIRENTVVGGSGFGFERTEDGMPIRLPHVGGVAIGNRVEIGALNTVVSGTIGPTVVEDDVKSDDHVHIAHNCVVRRGALLTACAQLSGSVEVGEYAWLGPNCSIMQGIKLGARCTIGLGAVVTKPVEDGVVVAGNPAQSTNELRAFSAAKSRLLKAIEQGRL